MIYGTSTILRHIISVNFWHHVCSRAPIDGVLGMDADRLRPKRFQEGLRQTRMGALNVILRDNPFNNLLFYGEEKISSLQSL